MAGEDINVQTTSWKCAKCKKIGKNGGNVITNTECKIRLCKKQRGKGDLAMSIMDVELGVFTEKDKVEYETSEAFGEHWIPQGSDKPWFDL